MGKARRKMGKVKKLKLKPSVRDKRRYFLVKASNAKVEVAILEYVGVLGLAKAAYMRIKDSYGVSGFRGFGVSGAKKDGYIVGSCLVKSLEDVRAALAFKGIRIEKVSGTLKGLRVSC